MVAEIGGGSVAWLARTSVSGGIQAMQDMRSRTETTARTPTFHSIRESLYQAGDAQNGPVQRADGARVVLVRPVRQRY